MRKVQWLKLLILATLVVCILVSAAAAADSLDLPVRTETQCTWDEAGRLIHETAVGPDGQPAINSRGFAHIREEQEG